MLQRAAHVAPRARCLAAHRQTAASSSVPTGCPPPSAVSQPFDSSGASGPRSSRQDVEGVEKDALSPDHSTDVKGKSREVYSMGDSADGASSSKTMSGPSSSMRPKYEHRISETTAIESSAQPLLPSPPLSSPSSPPRRTPPKTFSALASLEWPSDLAVASSSRSNISENRQYAVPKALSSPETSLTPSSVPSQGAWSPPPRGPSPLLKQASRPSNVDASSSRPKKPPANSKAAFTPSPSNLIAALAPRRPPPADFSSLPPSSSPSIKSSSPSQPTAPPKSFSEPESHFILAEETRPATDSASTVRMTSFAREESPHKGTLPLGLLPKVRAVPEPSLTKAEWKHKVKKLPASSALTFPQSAMSHVSASSSALSVPLPRSFKNVHAIPEEELVSVLAKRREARRSTETLPPSHFRSSSDPAPPKTVGWPVVFSEHLTGPQARESLVSLEPAPDRPPVAKLAHQLDRVLFNPGIHYLRDPRSDVHNFDVRLAQLPSPDEFDFARFPAYVTASKDADLNKLASSQGLKFFGSTSTLTSCLSQIYFLIGRWKEVNLSMLSAEWQNADASFSWGARLPAMIRLRRKPDGAYGVDNDKSLEGPGGNKLLSDLGKVMEKILTASHKDIARYRKDAPESAVSPEERSAREAYHYTRGSTLLMRSQLDGVDERLPGNGTFDIKTRSTCSIRFDRENSEEGSKYQLRDLVGPKESFERERYDMMRAAFLKYSLQCRIGGMDGIFCAYHTTARIHGFQYISLPEMDQSTFGSTEMGEQNFGLSVTVLERIFERAVSLYSTAPSIDITMRTCPEVRGEMEVFVQPTPLPEAKFSPSGLISVLRVTADSYLNGKRVAGEVSFDPKAVDPPPVWTVDLKILEATKASATRKQMHARHTVVKSDLEKAASVLLPTDWSEEKMQGVFEERWRKDVNDPESGFHHLKYLCPAEVRAMASAKAKDEEGTEAEHAAEDSHQDHPDAKNYDTYTTFTSATLEAAEARARKTEQALDKLLRLVESGGSLTNALERTLARVPKPTTTGRLAWSDEVFRPWADRIVDNYLKSKKKNVPEDWAPGGKGFLLLETAALRAATSLEERFERRWLDLKVEAVRNVRSNFVKAKTAIGARWLEVELAWEEVDRERKRLRTLELSLRAPSSSSLEDSRPARARTTGNMERPDPDAWPAPLVERQPPALVFSRPGPMVKAIRKLSRQGVKAEMELEKRLKEKGIVYSVPPLVEEAEETDGKTVTA